MGVSEVSPRIRMFVPSGAFALGGRISTALASIASSFLLTHLLPPAEVGTYFFAVSLISVGAGLAQSGLGQIAVRDIAAAISLGMPALALEAIRSAMRWCLIGTLLMGMLIVLGGALNGVSGFFILLAIAWMGTTVWQALLTEVMRGFRSNFAMLDIGSLVSGAGFLLALAGTFIIAGHSSFATILIFRIAGGIFSVLLLGVLLKPLTLKTWPAAPAGAIPRRKNFVKASYPLMLNSLLWIALMQMDFWILGALRPAEEVAIYGAAAKVASVVIIPNVLINAVVSPSIAAYHARGQLAELEPTLRRIANLTTVLALVIFVFFVIAGERLLGFLYGDYYVAGAAALIILSIGHIFTVWTGLCGAALIMSGQQESLLRISIVCVLIILVTAGILAQRFGYVGVATATCAGIVVQNILMLLYAKKLTGIWTCIRLR